MITGGVTAAVGVASLALAIRQTRRTPPPRDTETWRDIWSGDGQLDGKIKRSAGGVPVDFFDLLYVDTSVKVSLLQGGDARIEWRNYLVNWGKQPIASDSLELDFDLMTDELDASSIDARIIGAAGVAPRKLKCEAIERIPPSHYRYRFDFPSPLMPHKYLEYTVEYRAKGMFEPPVDDDGATRLFWTQKILRVTNRLRLTIELTDPSRTLTQHKAWDITPGGAEQLAEPGSDLKTGKATPTDGTEHNVSRLTFQYDYPPLGHAYKIEWSEQ